MVLLNISLPTLYLKKTRKTSLNFRSQVGELQVVDFTVRNVACDQYSVCDESYSPLFQYLYYTIIAVSLLLEMSLDLYLLY